jgi:hypothetical protein
MVFLVFLDPKDEGIYNEDILLSVLHFLLSFVVMLQAVIEIYKKL